MRAIFIATLATLPLAATGCVQNDRYEPYDPAPPYAEAQSASAALYDASGRPHGDVTITQLDDGIRLVIRGNGLSPGAHGVHIHMTGSCAAPDFTSAGGHWNPFGRAHGRDNPAGQHMGDMPNLLVGQDGSGMLEVTVNGARIAGGDAPLLDGDGAAIVIHAGPDDYRSDPSGNAGSRVACGEIVPGGF